MRHGKTNNHLGRTVTHRRALMANLAQSLILHKRISTTVAKAKALRKYVEPLLTKAKSDTTHNRRTVFSYIQSKEVIQELFDVVAEKITDRNGGYTRIIKTGNRLGDNADMCIIELVDYNELMLKQSAAKTKTTRRSRRGKATTTVKADAKETEVKAEKTETPSEETPKNEAADDAEVKE